MSLQAGASIQRAQALFLRTLEPKWMQTELRLNMSRIWREQFEKLCAQAGFCLLDVTEWNASLTNAVGLHLEDSLEAKRKRLKLALSEDVSASAEFGIVAQNNKSNLFGGILGDTASGLDGTNKEFGDEEPQLHRRGYSHKVSSSFRSLGDLSKDGSGDTEQTGRVVCQELLQDSKPSSKQVDVAIDSVVKKAFTEDERNGNFLKRISSFLTSTNVNFQHCDLWAPTQDTALGAIDEQVRITNAGHITIKSSNVPSHITKKLSEFGVYSKTLSFEDYTT